MQILYAVSNKGLLNVISPEWQKYDSPNCFPLLKQFSAFVPKI